VKNFTLKMFSLLIAILLAYFVHSDTNEGVIGISVPIELKGLPPQKVVVWPLVRQAQVSIKGPSFLLSQIYASPPVFRVKVPQDVGNHLTASLNKNDLTVPPSVTVLRVEPQEMEFTFDTLIKKEVPVQVEQFGALRDGIKLAEMIVKPSKITITGPEAEVTKITSISTEPIDLRDVTSDVERDINLRITSKVSDISANQVRVKIVVASFNVEKAFQGVPVEVRSLSGEMGKVEPERVNITVSGVKEKIANLKLEEVVPYVRLHQGAVDDNEYKVQVDLPKSLTLISVEPDVVKVLRSVAVSKKAVKGEGGKK